ncbi:MAG: hypothetical protein Q7K55_07755 [Candidatus Levybacteria bacterium]|nr:hypothetical protein [Candidatus Levybacteria bacterium]
MVESIRANIFEDYRKVRDSVDQPAGLNTAEPERFKALSGLEQVEEVEREMISCQQGEVDAILKYWSTNEYYEDRDAILLEEIRGAVRTNREARPFSFRARRFFDTYT